MRHRIHQEQLLLWLFCGHSASVAQVERFVLALRVFPGFLLG